MCIVLTIFSYFFATLTNDFFAVLVYTVYDSIFYGRMDVRWIKSAYGEKKS